MTNLLPYKGDYYLWKYVPSIGAAVFFILLFLGMSFCHSWRMFKTKTKSCWPFTIGCWFEFIGYIGRASAAHRTDKLMPYIIQSFFTLVAPALFAASIYMTLGRIMRSVRGEHHSIIKITRLTKVFVLGDVMSFMVQGGSSGLMFNQSTAKIGEDIVLLGLIVQIISFGLFFICAVIWHTRMMNNPTTESYNTGAPWKQTLYMLYTVSIAIFARSIFRCVEYGEGQSGYSQGHEWTLYIFDSIPMFIVTVIYFIWYPSRLNAPPAAADEYQPGLQMGPNTNEGQKPNFRSEFQGYLSP
ncbi:hypothetical protein BP6252_12486 [Coleophoma cylindrospora]|uniref:Uncharacterized protein n=1 Tax=Coleophoma cylindrospora TaxID=1849047 RepID=A0A3D8QGZ2_9HELO|nr:hypothetical protein BP6252_12486 [Coleophoma cylindrospora]